jgi:flagellar hook-associated protein 2
MPNTSISGLVSGLDTATIISQLMQIEARPQTLLKSKMSTEQKVVTALQGLNTKLATITTRAGDLAKSGTWNATKATSTNDKVLVTAGPGTRPSSISFTVDQLAAAGGAMYTTQGTVNGSTTDTVMTAGVDYTITYDDGRAAETISTGDGSLRAITDAINGTTGLKATLVRAGVAADGSTPTYALQVVSTATGATSGFGIAEASPADPANPVPFMGGASSVTQGANAKITLAGQTTALEFTSNTITGLMPGVDVTLQPGATGPATITVARDVQSLSDSVKSMVDAVNAALDEISKQTAYDVSTKTGGLLTGDSTVRDVRNQLLSAVSGGVGGTSLAGVGIEVDRYGKLTFDEAKFKSAYAADPATTQELLAGKDADPITGAAAVDGFGDIIERLGKRFSDSIDGTVTLSIKSRQAGIKGMEDDIADWDIRLADRQTTLQRQYTALETALGKLQSQSTWLAGQISSLPQMNSGK